MIKLPSSEDGSRPIPAKDERTIIPFPSASGEGPDEKRPGYGNNGIQEGPDNRLEVQEAPYDDRLEEKVTGLRRTVIIPGHEGRNDIAHTFSGSNYDGARVLRSTKQVIQPVKEGTFWRILPTPFDGTLSLEDLDSLCACENAESPSDSTLIRLGHLRSIETLGCKILTYLGADHTYVDTQDRPIVVKMDPAYFGLSGKRLFSAWHYEHFDREDEGLLFSAPFELCLRGRLENDVIQSIEDLRFSVEGPIQISSHEYTLIRGTVYERNRSIIEGPSKMESIENVRTLLELTES